MIKKRIKDLTPEEIAEAIATEEEHFRERCEEADRMDRPALWRLLESIHDDSGDTDKNGEKGDK